MAWYGLAILLAAAAADTDDTVLEPRPLGELTLLPPLEWEWMFTLMRVRAMKNRMSTVRC